MLPEGDSTTVSDSFSRVLIVTVVIASIIGLTPIMLTRLPGTSSSSSVSISTSNGVPEKIAALKLESIAPKYNCPPDQNLYLKIC